MHNYYAILVYSINRDTRISLLTSRRCITCHGVNTKQVKPDTQFVITWRQWGSPALNCEVDIP